MLLAEELKQEVEKKQKEDQDKRAQQECEIKKKHQKYADLSFNRELEECIDSCKYQTNQGYSDYTYYSFSPLNASKLVSELNKLGFKASHYDGSSYDKPKIIISWR